MKKSATKKSVKPSLDRPVVSLDFAFKRIFRNKSDYRVIEGFLAILFKKQSVTIQAILESASNPKNETDKSNCVDIKVQIDNKEVVIVEIQFRYEYDYFERTLFGVSKAVCEQLKKGEPYSNIKKVYAVSIVYFDMGEDADYVFEGKLDLKGRHTKAPVKLIPSLAEKFGTDAPGEALSPA
jgi:predicted transposase/invertase (TIGR01784 family)